MKKLIATTAAGFAAFGLAAAAHATTFVFKGDGGLYDTPTGNIAYDCGSVGVDFCSDNDALGLSYSKDGINVTAKGYVSGDAAQLIQDITPDNSGLGALSELDNINDQTQTDSNEIIEFTFDQVVTLSNIEFNAGNDTDCSTFGSEGPCGDFDLYIDNVFFATITAVDLLAGGFVGTVFRFTPVTSGAGFAIAQFDVQAIPLPGALPLLFAGLAGLGFASRRKQSV